MKHLFLLIFLLPVINSCQSGNLEPYQMSWVAWAFLVAGGIGLMLVFVLKKGVVSDIEESAAKVSENASGDYKTIGDYIGGHPEIRRPIPGFVFRKNSHCCVFFYSNHTDNPPEFRFKIKAGAFRNISVENRSSFKNGNTSLPDKTVIALRKKNNAQMAFLKIDWMDGESGRTAFFSFEGADALEKADKAKAELLGALSSMNNKQ